MKIQDLFCFNVTNFPEPYNKYNGSARVAGVVSKYTTQTAPKVNYSTLSNPVIIAVEKAIIAETNPQERPSIEECPFGFGENENYSFAQYSITEEEFILAAYSKANNRIIASKYYKSTGVMEAVALTPEVCAAVFMALMPICSADEEFLDCYNYFIDNFDFTISEIPCDTEKMAMLGDNLYRRMTNSTIGFNVVVEDNDFFLRLASAQIDSGHFNPTKQFIGNLDLLQSEENVEETEEEQEKAKEAFAGSYAFPNRVLSEYEQSLVPELASHIQIPKYVKTICEHIKLTTDRPVKMRNFMLRGTAGTGKTTAAKIISAGLNLPCGVITCSADTQIFDLLGSIIPDTDVGLGDKDLEQERQELIDMGGINFQNISKILSLPSFETIDYEPAKAYQMLTGTEKADASAEECVQIVMQRVIEKTKQLCISKDGSLAYKYVETPLIKAIKNGWVCEIQEPTVIMQAGVLVGLNSLLEQDGNIVLPTGEVIKRHPDAVIIITTNVSYEGCRNINQSVTDRMSLIFDIPNPNVDVMTERAMKATGCTDKAIVTKMAKTVIDIEGFCKEKCITDGSVGMRGLIDWVNSYMITKNALASAELTIVSKATSDEDDRAAIIASCVSTQF